MEVKGFGSEFGKARGKDQVDFGVSFDQILSYGQAAYGSEFDIQKGYVTDVFGGKGKKLFCAPEAVKFGLGNSFFMASVRFSRAILSSSSAMTSIKDLLNSEKGSNIP